MHVRRGDRIRLGMADRPELVERIALLKPSLLFSMARNLPDTDPRRAEAVRRLEPLLAAIRARHADHPKVQRVIRMPVPCPSSDG